MRTPIQPIHVPTQSQYVEALRGHIEDELVQQLVMPGAYPGLMIDVAAEDMRDYVKVTAFLTDAKAVPAGEAVADALMDRLGDEGHRVFIYVRSWTR